MCDKQVATKFEDISNEILIECFEYFHSADLFYSFEQLNHRFNQLIRTLPLHLNFQYIDKLLYDEFCAQILINPDIQTRVYSLRLSNLNTPGQIGDFLSKFALDHFIHLRSLTFTYVVHDDIDSLQQILPKLSQITVLNLLDSQVYPIKFESFIPIDNLQTLSWNSDMIFLQRIIPVKSLTISSVSLNDICHLFQYTPLLEYLSVSYVAGKDFNLKYRRCSRPVHLKSLNFIKFASKFADLADFLRTMSNLRNFTISSSSDSQMLEATRWQELITASLPSLTNFQFQFELKHQMETSDILKLFREFETDFWQKEHQWYTECASSITKSVIVIYTIPYLAQWKQLPLQSTRYCFNALTDYGYAFKNVTELVVSKEDLFKHGTYYFPNVTSLEIEDSKLTMIRAAEQDLQEALNSLINLSKLNHLKISVQCRTTQPSVLFQFLQLAPQLSSLTVTGCFYGSLTVQPELSRYLTEKIRKLEIIMYFSCSGHQRAIIPSLLKVIPNLERLTTPVNDVNDVSFVLKHFSKLLSFTVSFDWTDDGYKLSAFKKQALEQNVLFYRETTFFYVGEPVIHVSAWMRKNEQCTSN